MSTQNNGRPPAPALTLHSRLNERLADYRSAGGSLRSLVRAIAPLVCERTFFVILSGRGRATPTALCATNVIAEIVGGCDRSERVEGLVLDPPNVALVAQCLCRLAQEGPAARAFASERFQQLKGVHSVFAAVEDSSTQPEVHA